MTSHPTTRPITLRVPTAHVDQLEALARLDSQARPTGATDLVRAAILQYLATRGPELSNAKKAKRGAR